MKSYPGRIKKNMDFSYLLHLKVRDIPYVLRMEDRNSMFNSLETRVPFLDFKFINYAFNNNFTNYEKRYQ